MIQLVVLLEVIDSAAFQEFEMKAVNIMRSYGGQVLAAFEPDQVASSSSNIAEVHYLQFPNIDVFNNYRRDPQLLEMSELRKKAISGTTIFISGNVKDYG